ncbi:MerR family transcriptional regulator [Plantactinospora sp. WMMB782]|uniref:MerR family transcriptional regulator n=1 Tax=Plantactinospora sp. WMMB782 TaxID=3404121 RepID=UPI003B95D863
MNEDRIQRQTRAPRSRCDRQPADGPQQFTAAGLRAGAVARRLGVAPTTLRSWHQRYGVGPSAHQAGRHRRYTPADVALLTVMAQLTARGVPAGEAAQRARQQIELLRASPPSVDAGTQVAARSLARAARRMDVSALREALMLAATTHGVVHTWHALAVPAFIHISRAGHSRPRKAVARRILARCLSEVLAAVPRPAAGTPVSVLLVGVNDRRDEAALDALAAALAEQGIASLYLGSGLPVEAVTDAAGRCRPAVVVAWSHARRPGTPHVIAALSSLPGRQPTIVTAGQGWTSHFSRPPEPVVTCTGLADTVAAVTRLVPPRKKQ